MSTSPGNTYPRVITLFNAQISWVWNVFCTEKFFCLFPILGNWPKWRRIAVCKDRTQRLKTSTPMQCLFTEAFCRRWISVSTMSFRSCVQWKVLKCLSSFTDWLIDSSLDMTDSFLHVYFLPDYMYMLAVTTFKNVGLTNMAWLTEGEMYTLLRISEFAMEIESLWHAQVATNLECRWNHFMSWLIFESSQPYKNRIRRVSDHTLDVLLW